MFLFLQKELLDHGLIVYKLHAEKKDYLLNNCLKNEIIDETL